MVSVRICWIKLSCRRCLMVFEALEGGAWNDIGYAHAALEPAMNPAY